MPYESFSLRATSPLFLNGANSKEKPEPRTASVRGQVRYWLRALEGPTRPEREVLWEVESQILGSTEHGSQVSMRFWCESNRGQVAISEAEMLPHRSNEHDRGSQEAIEAGNLFRLDLVTRPGLAINKRFVNAIYVWLLLGGIGKRSRRMFGGLVMDALTPMTGSPENLASYITKRIAMHVKTPARLHGLPDFPMLHPEHSRIIVGTKGYPDHRSLVIALFRDLLRNDTYRPHERSFGYARQGRRASPLIAQAREIDGKFYPVLTVMRSKPDRDINWDIVKRFMDDAKSKWNGIEAWGEWR